MDLFIEEAEVDVVSRQPVGLCSVPLLPPLSACMVVNLVAEPEISGSVT